MTSSRPPHPATTLVDRLRAAGCVFAEREAAVLRRAFPRPAALEKAVARRCSGEPLEYVVGVAQFAGVAVEVGPPAFIPRRRAEALIDVAEELVAADAQTPRVAVDLGCGCGALAAAFRERHPRWRVLGCDRDAEALTWAARNGSRYGFEICSGHWFHALPSALRGGLDLVLAHLPYVPSGQLASLPRDFRAVEPDATVDGGVDGLQPWREVAAAALDWLQPDGALLVQVAASQVTPAIDIAQRCGLSAYVVEADDAVVLVSRPAGGRTHP